MSPVDHAEACIMQWPSAHKGTRPSAYELHNCLKTTYNCQTMVS